MRSDYIFFSPVKPISTLYYLMVMNKAEGSDSHSQNALQLTYEARNEDHITTVPGIAIPTELYQSLHTCNAEILD